jgi:isoquinoline 1-oxidoreductase subunit beta
VTAVIRSRRREFLAGLGLCVGGLALGVFPGNAHGIEPSGRAGPGPTPASQEHALGSDGLSPNVLVHVAPDGQVTIICHRSEMGQGVRSSIPILIADELGASLERVVVRQADGDPRYGDQNTDGSSSIRRFYDDLRRAGAAARQMLIAAAAKRWKVDPDACVAVDHQVTHLKSKRSLGFGELVPAASKLPVPKPEQLVLRPAAELRNVARPDLPLLDGPDYVTGKAVFGADITLPDLRIAVIARPPVVGGTVKRYDAEAAMAIPGVERVIEMPAPKKPWMFQPWGGVAVVATNTWAALQGRAALAVEWDDGDEGKQDSASLREELLASVRAPGKPLRVVGDLDAAVADAASLVQAEYLVPHLPHLSMEPPAAIAKVADGKAELWVATQNPQAARKEVARILGMSEDDVTVHVTLLGGGFGRKSKADFPSEAAFLAREVGFPVRVQWTRDDDIRHDYYNAINAQWLRAGLDDRGKVVAWQHRTAFPPIASTFDHTVDQPSVDDIHQGVLDLALDVPNVRAEACKAKAHVRVGWYRSVYNIFHAFAVGSFVDELAAARGVDPRNQWLELIGPARVLDLAALGVDRLTNYGESLERHPVDAGRLRNVIERVTASARWDDRIAAGRHLGLAAHRSFVTYTAVVVSVVRDKTRKLRIDEAWISMDPGTVVNQDRVLAQMEGGLIMGISNALFGGVTLAAGRVEQSNFHDARIARIRDTPRKIHTDLVASDAPPGGVGEPPVPPVSAAVANAVFALTGERIRELPIARTLGV